MLLDHHVLETAQVKYRTWWIDQMQDPSLQLQGDLRASILRSLATRRPILTHLNADTSWLLSLVQPSSTDADHSTPRRRRFNVLIDPWLQGPQSDVAGWFSTQWHAIESCVQTISELEAYLAEVEELAAEAEEEEAEQREKEKSKKSTPNSTPNRSLRAPINIIPIGILQSSPNGTSSPSSSDSYISAVLISHEFSDHCHRATLLELPPSTPIYAASTAVSLIRSWSHFHHVYAIPSFEPTAPWPREKLSDALPEWLRVARITTENNVLYYHAALAIMFKNQGFSSPTSIPKAEAGSGEAEAEAIIYTPHGISASSLRPLLFPLQSQPPSKNASATAPHVSPLALLHGLHRIRLLPTSQLNLGLPNARDIVDGNGNSKTIQGGGSGDGEGEARRFKYWVGTHDEVKQASGFVSWLLRFGGWGIR